MIENIKSVDILDKPQQPQPNKNGSANYQNPPTPGPPRLIWAWRILPNTIVLALIAGVAYWGHANDWSVPKFTDLMGGGEVLDGDWCKEHAVPESQCVECNESLLPKSKSVWCAKHGIHDCPLERPEIAQLPTIRTITQADLDRAQRGLDLKDRPENNQKCKLHERRIQFASQEVMEKMGIDIAPVFEAPIVETISASGEITFERPRVAPIFTPVAGRVWYVSEQGQVGSKVKRGDVLAFVDSMEVGKAKAEFLQVYSQFELRNKTLQNLNSLFQKGAVSEVEIAGSGHGNAQS